MSDQIHDDEEPETGLPRRRGKRHAVKSQDMEENPREVTLPSKEYEAVDHELMCGEIRISIGKLEEELEKACSKSSLKCCVDQMPPKSCIFRVPHQLRNVKPEAYEPQIISIGPYHHYKRHLEPMKEHKKHCLNSILARNNGSLGKYVEAMRLREKEARQCYADQDVYMGPPDFAEMMLLDGCFILELIRNRNLVKENPAKQAAGQIFNVKLALPEVAYDLLLLENQLPLFILEQLFEMSTMPNEEESFVQKALSFFCLATDRDKKHQPHQDSVKHDHQHLLGLVYGHCVSQINRNDVQSSNKGSPQLRYDMRNATGLKEAGVKFEAKKQESSNEITTSVSLFEIEFDLDRGIMKIPTLRVEDHTERIIRNLIAHEQFIFTPTYVSHYAVFMDCLINSYNDVELLCRHKVIENWLGDHGVVAQLFNRLCDHVKISYPYYPHVNKAFDDVGKYCSHRWNEWRATLMHDYFNNPWAFISFLAALVLLLVTIGQFIVAFFK